MKAILTALTMMSFVLLQAQETQKTDSTSKPIEQLELSVKEGKVNAKVQTMNPDSTISDTTRIELKNAYITIVNKNEDFDDDDDWTDSDQRNALTWWSGIDIGFNGLLGADRDFYMDDESRPLRPEFGRSRYISLNFAQYRFRLIKDYVGLTVGATVQIYNFKYDGGTEFNFVGDSLFYSPSGDKNINKNKIRATYVGIPLMFEFNTSDDPDNVFHVSAGVIGKVRIGNMYKQKFDLDGNSLKTSQKGDLGFNRWGLDATARIGYKRLTLFAQVGLLPMFDNANTPDVYTWSSGLFIKF
jgi:hypothetical protein